MAKIGYERLAKITYEQELAILAEVYRLALASYRKRKQEADEPTQPDGRDDAKESNGCIATDKYNRRSA
jgi:hypothetical protein